MYKINKKTALNILKEVSKIISIDELHNCMKDLSHTDAINIVRNIFGGESREAEYIARQYNIRLSDIPTEIDSDGNKYWRNEEGQLHREDGPAIEGVYGTKEWYINGQQHREDGPAFERSDGYKQWFINGELHRVDGPAIESANGYKEWFVNGKLHREDGPAIENADGYKEWWIDGEEYSEKEFNKKIAEISK